MLMKHQGNMPNDYYKSVTHLWIAINNKVEVCEKTMDVQKGGYYIHEDRWGRMVWHIPERGYYSQKHGLIHSHGQVNERIKRQLAKKFSDAMYIHEG